MGEIFLWEEQLEIFIKSYLSQSIMEQYKNYIREMGSGVRLGVQDFIPQEANKLYTYENNHQYHLNGRSIFGVLMRWMAEKKENKTIHCNGCSINTGLIQADHSGFMTNGMEKIFIKVNSRTELIDTAKRLFSLTNEDMIREFKITSSSQSDIATLFNTIILDSIIDYEIERDNFGGYYHCWNDSNFIAISTKNVEGAYSIGLQNTNDRDKPKKQMIIKLPNGESIIYRQKFKNNTEQNQYTIDDISTEIIEVNGNSELIQKIVAQIERFSGRELKQEDSNDDIEKKVSDSASTYTSEEIALLKRQILTKKLQIVLDEFKNGNNSIQQISIEEFELLQTMLLFEKIAGESVGYDSSGNTVAIPDWYTPIPAKQYIIIQLPESKRISVEFLARENSGTIRIKDFHIIVEPEDDGDFIRVRKSIDEQELIDSFNEYHTDESLKQLLTRELQLQECELVELEETKKAIDAAETLIGQRKNDQDKGE